MSGFGRSEDGQELVEYAILLPVLLLLLFGIMEAGGLIYSYNTIANAAREGARYGATHPGDVDGVEDAARRLATGLNEEALTVDTTMDGTRVRVEVGYSYGLTVAMIVQAFGGNSTVGLTAVSTMRSE